MTLSGCPHVLREFVDNCTKMPSRAVHTAISAPYHAPHIYTEQDVQEVYDVSEHPKQFRSLATVISGSTGDLLGGMTFSEHLENAVRDILIRPLDLNAVTRTVAGILKRSDPKKVSLIPVGTNIAGRILDSLDSSQRERCAITAELLKNPTDTGDTYKSRTAPGRSKIAIIGMSGRFPGAANTEAFWDLLYQGLDVHRTVPEDRFDVKAHFDSSGKRKNTSRIINGCWIDEPGLFDPKFFNISPKEAEQSDPGQRLALQTAYEAIEMAGIVPDRTPSTRRERVGVFYGMTSDDWREVNSGQDVDTYFIPGKSHQYSIFPSHTSPGSLQIYTGGNRAFTPGRLNYFFKFSGPSVSVDTACSSSLAAFHIACNSLWRNDCDTAIAGGTNVMTNPDNFAGLDRGYFLSRTGELVVTCWWLKDIRARLTYRSLLRELQDI